MRILSRRKRATSTAPAGSGLSLLDPQLTIKGDLQTAGSLRIEGRLEGNIRGADSVVLGVGATMTGDIQAREVVLGGTLTGNVHASERVELQATATITGDVRTGSVLIQEGGVVNGRVLMGAPGVPMPAPSAPFPAPTARPLKREIPELARS
jgi:cytoskeletal protein CcmA (bactofilin family)